MPGRNANAYSDPHAFTYRNSYTDGNSYTDSDRNGYGNDHTTSISYANSYCYRNGNIHTEANADAKAAAYALPSSDAVNEWVKKLKELKSKRELARPAGSLREALRAWPLASSLLCGGSTSPKAMVTESPEAQVMGGRPQLLLPTR